MGLGIDLETATAEPYHAMKADDRNQAARGRGRRGCCSAACSASAENEVFFVRFLIAITATVCLLALFAIVVTIGLTYHEPSFSIHLTGYEGIDPGRAARIVSPSFNVTLRMNNTCVDSARVAVTYSGVALGWAGVEPRDCAEGRWAGPKTSRWWRGEAGLSRRLRDRMASDWRSGAVELDVNVMMYRDRQIGSEIPRTFDGKVKMIKKITIQERQD